MNLIYSCVFVNENYINLIENLLKSYNKFNNNSDNYYLIVTSNNFEEKVKKVIQEINLKNYFIWTIDISYIYEATYSRYYIYNFPKINEFDKILYLDCDIIIPGNIDILFKLNIDDKFYTLYEEGGRLTHCGMLSDKEFNEFDKSNTFTTAIILFNNNETMLDYLKKTYEYIKKFHNIYKNPLPCYDQPIVNKLFFDNNCFNNKLLNNYCFNISPGASQDDINIQSLSNYLIIHFATDVGDYNSKIQRINVIKYLLNV